MTSEHPIPILMYHSVGRAIQGWKSPWFTLPARIFADHLEWLARNGYRGVTLDQIRDHVAEEKSLPQKSVAITFDDGYLDNWTYAVPILKRYGFSATVFVTTDFIDPREVVRPTLDDAGFDAIDSETLDVRGFVSWLELEKASEEGVLSVQSHGLTHTYYPRGPEVFDFHHPGDSYLWLDWNAHPEDKPFYMTRLDQNSVPWGAPVYAHGKSLQITRYFPDPREADHLTEFVRDRGGESFFQGAGWRNILESEVKRIRKERSIKDRHETAEERSSRYEYELRESKRRIEQRLGRRADYFVFPGGGYNDESFGLALSIYRSVPLRSPDNERIKNQPGEDPRFLSRRGTQFISTGARGVYAGGAYLVEYLREYQGSGLARRRRQVMKLGYLTGLRIGLWG